MKMLKRVGSFIFGLCSMGLMGWFFVVHWILFIAFAVLLVSATIVWWVKQSQDKK